MAAKIVEANSSEGSVCAGTEMQKNTPMDDIDKVKEMLAIEIIESRSDVIHCSKVKQFWVCTGVRCALLELGDFNCGCQSVWQLGMEMMSKILSKSVGDKLEIPVMVEVRKRQGNIAHLHVSIGKF